MPTKGTHQPLEHHTYTAKNMVVDQINKDKVSCHEAFLTEAADGGESTDSLPWCFVFLFVVYSDGTVINS
jgi:hypothetical protein